MALKILKITDGRAGHITVSDGVIEAIRKNHKVEIIEFDTKIRAKLLLQILKFILKYDLLSNKLVSSDFFIKLFYKNYYKPNAKIDLIVSTGGDTSFINAWLSHILNVKNIFCSSLRGIDPKYFSLIVSVFEPDLKNGIKLELAPTKINFNGLSQKVEYFCKGKKIDKYGKYFVLLIGGDGEGYEYTKDDYEDLVYSFMSIVKKYEAKALITTSRRTGTEYEILLNELFSNYANDIAYSVYFGKNPEKIVQVYLDLGSKIFVTEESESMITESLCFKKPVFTLSPRITKEHGKYKKYKMFVNTLSKNKRIVRLSIGSDLSNVDLDKFDFKYIEKLPIDYLAEKIQPYL